MQTGCLALYLIQSPIFTSSTVGAFLLFHFCTFFFYFQQSDVTVMSVAGIISAFQGARGKRTPRGRSWGERTAEELFYEDRMEVTAPCMRSDDSSMWFIFLFQYFKLSRCEGVTVLWNLVAVSLEVTRLSSAAARLQLWTLRWDFLPPH